MNMDLIHNLKLLIYMTWFFWSETFKYVRPFTIDDLVYSPYAYYKFLNDCKTGWIYHKRHKVKVDEDM